MSLSKKIREKYELGDLLHLTHVSNLTSIFSNSRIYSKNSLSTHSIYYKDISNPSVQEGREAKTLACTGEPLHNYVPFYFGKKTPMVASLQSRNSEFVFLQFSSDLLEDYDCVITDGNARSGNTQSIEYLNIESLELIDSKSVNTVKYAHDAEIKRKKQSEVLVYDFIGLEHLKCVICYDDGVKTTVSSIKSANSINCGVYVNANAYYF
ncbi:MAG: DUF4433 domain-containing protein [Oligoflexia bacterium]|nr:DUF4433 domain-containing protein [Oligoflexia bacterium]